MLSSFLCILQSPTHSHGLLMDSTSPHEVPMESPWSPCGVPVESPWSPHGVHEDYPKSPWSPCGALVESLWSPHGVLMESMRTPPKIIESINLEWTMINLG